jgi:integrase-like protein
MSRPAALAALQPYMDAVNVAPAPTPRRVGKTFSDAMQEWREQIAVNLKRSTVRAAESHLAQHIERRLGNFFLQDRTARNLQAFVTSTAATGVTRKTTLQKYGHMVGDSQRRAVNTLAEKIERHGIELESGAQLESSAA